MLSAGRTKPKAKRSTRHGKRVVKSEDFGLSPLQSMDNQGQKLNRPTTSGEASRPRRKSARSTVLKTKTNEVPTTNVNVPRNTAIHFGAFYGLEGGGKSGNGTVDKSSNERDALTQLACSTPKLEFTRQMVYKLERSTGTAEYARQVSALLAETVEPPNFNLQLPPTENSIPDGKENPSGYPLWYKEPRKLFAGRRDLRMTKEACEDSAKYKEMDRLFERESSEEEDKGLEVRDLYEDGKRIAATLDFYDTWGKVRNPSTRSVSTSSSVESTESFDSTDVEERDDNNIKTTVSVL